MTGLGENHVASQIELPTIGNTKNASLQRGKIFRWHQRAGARRAQCQSKKTGRIEGKVVDATKRTRKGCKQWCPGWSEHIALSYAWQNDVKASVYNAWQISPLCRMLVVGAFVLDGSNRFHDKKSRSDCAEGRERDGPLELRRNNGKCEHM